MKSVGFSTYLQRLPRGTRNLLFTCVYGVAAGGAAVAFHLCIHWLFESTFVAWSRGPLTTFMLGSLAVIMGSSLLVGYLLTNFCPEARGSGIPQLKVSFWKDFGWIPWRVAWVKFVTGVLSVGGGSSLGREGPSVHLAGGLASNLAGLMGEPKQNRRPAAAAGAAAGLAAAFNTPLAAITFVLEEIVADMNSRFLGGILLASVLGAFVVHGVLGEQPAFTLGSVDSISWPIYLLIPVVAASSSAVGVVFQKSTIGLRAKRKGFGKVPAWIRPSIGALITWVLGVSVFVGTGRLGVFGLGYGDLSAGLNNQLEWKVAGILMGAKLIATFACYGFGSSGGIFSPTLFLGGMCGVFLSGIFGLGIEMSPSDHILLAAVGMSACLGAVVRAPITGILIVFEMTHEFNLVPALMLGALVSQAVGITLCKHNFYEEILIQDGHDLDHLIPPRDLQSWQQLPVSAIANFKPVTLRSMEPKAIGELLKGHPYQYFPVVIDGKARGVLARKEAESALSEERAPRLEPAVSCRPNQTVRRLQFLLLDSSSGMVLLEDGPEGTVLGLVTLHDLLRAEVSIAKGHEV